MSVKKRVLGRGLDALIAPVEIQAVPAATDGRRVIDIPLTDIRPNIHQPRTHFDDEHIAELAESIREKGILQPLLVRRHFDKFELIAGERRFRAAQLIGLATVPCLVNEVTDEQSFEIAIIENLQREDLNAIEEARAYHALIEQFGLSQEQAAQRVGKSRPAVANSLRLMNLPLDIQEDIYEGRLSAGHARAILQVQEVQKQRHLRNLIVSKGLSVREAEAQARSMNREKVPKPPKPATFDAQMRSLQEQFSMKIGVPVFIKPVSSDSGKIEIQYHSLDDFEQISDFFGVEKL